MRIEEGDILLSFSSIKPHNIPFLDPACWWTERMRSRYIYTTTMQSMHGLCNDTPRDLVHIIRGRPRASAVLNHSRKALWNNQHNLVGIKTAMRDARVVLHSNLVR